MRAPRYKKLAEEFRARAIRIGFAANHLCLVMAQKKYGSSVEARFRAWMFNDDPEVQRMRKLVGFLEYRAWHCCGITHDNSRLA